MAPTGHRRTHAPARALREVQAVGVAVGVRPRRRRQRQPRHHRPAAHRLPHRRDQAVREPERAQTGGVGGVAFGPGRGPSPVGGALHRVVRRTQRGHGGHPGAGERRHHVVAQGVVHPFAVVLRADPPLGGVAAGAGVARPRLGGLRQDPADDRELGRRRRRVRGRSGRRSRPASSGRGRPPPCTAGRGGRRRGSSRPGPVPRRAPARRPARSPARPGSAAMVSSMAAGVGRRRSDDSARSRACPTTPSAASVASTTGERHPAPRVHPRGRDVHDPPPRPYFRLQYLVALPEGHGPRRAVRAGAPPARSPTAPIKPDTREWSFLI